ncbi:hypothetical protein Q4534_18225 [Cyclobacterium sp. 1_MG-2023]|uniref:hypothetical protein n=1 Tax=Cyclobacterium sp. 1_MG-2023 TaxID=3062681 RepID=UPI0026E33B7C|nr:hypothetical protein [Cyclobacterium sp. 1_MG-2023]MDO6439367.1 hypothetical protein [Cyclobacterium sp. 1_MG-2023]|eukprot:TRINITY_DN49800_c0_g1_i1.p1 TRINITY_DN49800_c0_g1~~TRINITY_DN49800_c0_g1_i1.p1  ORF type:complete len:139 (+),score=12.14 TRINITY_DN49800_c0_g1_i1:94-510(+)
MIKAPLALLILLCVSVFSCSPKESQNELLKEKVIQVHDEVMPKIGELKASQKKLNEMAGNLEQSEDAKDTEKAAELKAVAADCEHAYDEMFVWMRQFDVDLEEMSEEQAKSYLEEQLEKVDKVKKDILEALEKSEALL